MKLIINADDFGIDIDRDFGIFYGVMNGYITSVSIVVTNKIGLIRKMLVWMMRKKASIGIHINLTDNPLVKYNMEEICDINYEYERRKYVFWKNSIDNKLNINKIKEEIEEQFDRFMKEYGFIPNHIDGHNHCNIFNKEVEKIFEEISKIYSIHLRIPYEDLNKFDKSLLENNEYFNEYYMLKEEVDKDTINNNLDYFFKYDMYLYNYMCIKNCIKDINYIGTMYGYFRDSKVLIDQLLQFDKKDCVQVMTHPGFYWRFIKHNTKFSNKDRNIELKSLKALKKQSKKLKFIYADYKK